MTSNVQFKVEIWPLWAAGWIDLTPAVRNVAFRVSVQRQGNGFSLVLKVAPDSPLYYQLQGLRDFDWVRITITTPDGGIVHYLGYTQDLEFAFITDAKGNVITEWQISGYFWADLLFQTRVRNPVMSRDLPGMMALGEWLKEFSRLFAEGVQETDLSMILGEIIRKMMTGLYPLEGKPLIEHIDWGYWGQLLGIAWRGTENVAQQLSFSVEEMVETVISRDLAECFGLCADDGRLVLVLRQAPLLIWDTLRDVPIPASYLQSIRFHRLGGSRITAWFPGSIGQMVYGSPFIMDFGEDIPLPIIEVPLLARCGFAEKVVHDPALPPLRLIQENMTTVTRYVAERTLKARRIGMLAVESLDAQVSLKPANAFVRVGGRVTLDLPRAVVFHEWAPEEYQGGNLKVWPIITTNVTGYVAAAQWQLIVSQSGSVETTTDLTLRYVLPAGKPLPLNVPPLPRLPKGVLMPKEMWLPITGVYLGEKDEFVPFSAPVFLLSDTWQNQLNRGKRKITVTDAGTIESNIRGFVIHHTGTRGANETIKVFKQRDVSSHFLIDTAGAVYQVFSAPFSTVTYHAKGVNDLSIGIDLIGGPATLGGGGQQLTQTQAQSLVALIKLLCAKAGLQTITKQTIWPYRLKDTSVEEWAKERLGGKKPLQEQPGIFAHNQLDADKFDPCQPNDETTYHSYWNDVVIKQWKA